MVKFLTDKPDDKGVAKTLKITNATLGKVELSGYEYPQVESLEDFQTFAGGAEGALEFINSAIRSAAINNGRAKIANKEFGDGEADGDKRDSALSALVKDALDTIRTYTPVTDSTRGPTQKEKAGAYDKVKEAAKAAAAEGRALDPAELMALLEANK